MKTIGLIGGMSYSSTIIYYELLNKLSNACFDQNAAKTAVNMVVFVARRDKWRIRAKQNLNFLENMFNFFLLLLKYSIFYL